MTDRHIAVYHWRCTQFPDLSGVDPDSARVAFREAHWGRCAICCREEKLVRDHDHCTGLVRGLLCGWCNQHTPSYINQPRRDSKPAIFDRYVQWPPAAVMNYREVYKSSWVDDPAPDLWQYIWQWGAAGWWREKDDLFKNNAAARVGL